MQKQFETGTIYALCNKHKLFTCGSNSQYDKLFTLAGAGITQHELAKILYVCSDKTLDEIYAITGDLFKDPNAPAEYNYEWTHAEDIVANKHTERKFRGWGVSTLHKITGATDQEYRVAHGLWLKLMQTFNDEAAGYIRGDHTTSKLGSIGEVDEREVCRSNWWDALGGDENGDYDKLTRIIEILHQGETLETGTISFGS